MYLNAIQEYRKTNIITADSGRLVLMCYEAAIDHLKIVKIKYQKKDYEDKFKALTKATNLIEELLYSLDLEKGGSIARNLEALYNYILRRIIQADSDKDIAAFDEVIGILTELLSAWEEIFSGQKGNVQPEAIGTYPVGENRHTNHISI